MTHCLAQTLNRLLKISCFFSFGRRCCHNCIASKSKDKSDWWSQIVCLTVQVSLGQLVDVCHSLPCQGHFRANKALPWKVYNNHWQEECCLFVMTHTRRWAHVLYLYVRGTYTFSHTDKQTRTHTHSKYLHSPSVSVSKLPSEFSLVRLHMCIFVCVSMRNVHVCV